jgi:tetraacyldisaccharide 4'-kinase
MAAISPPPLAAGDRLRVRLNAILSDDGRNSDPVTLLLYGFSRVYGRIVEHRVRRLRRRPGGIRRLPCPVISVGNLTTGGTGKTPMTAYLAGLLWSRGLKAVILSRGYGGRAERGGLIVSSGAGPRVSAAIAGDEAYLLAQRLPKVPVVVGRNRYAMGKAVLEELDPDCYLLDDGFQHIQLHRDLNLALLDYRRPFGNGHLLPRGHLREPLTALARADAIVLTRSELRAASPHAETLQRFGKPIFRAEHRSTITRCWRAGRPASVDKTGRLPADAEVFVFSGIADNAAFRKAAEGLGGRVVGFCAFADHHPYTPRDVDAIQAAAAAAGATALLTTAKDFVRLPRVPNGVDEVYVADAEFAFHDLDFTVYIQDQLARLMG